MAPPEQWCDPMTPASGFDSAPGGHPRLLRCRVANPGGEESVRFVELEQFRLWEYMMRTRHGIEVHALQLGLWIPPAEFHDHAQAFAHGGAIEKVTRITLSLFNPRHGYTLDIDRFVPSKHCGTVKRILLSHLTGQGLDSQYVDLVERHGMCVCRPVEEPAVELILGLSDVEAFPNGTAAA